LVAENADQAKSQVEQAAKTANRSTRKRKLSGPMSEWRDNVAAAKKTPDAGAPKQTPGTVSPKLRLAYARMMEKQGNVAEARSAYTQLLAEDRRSVDALVGLARVDQLAGRTAEAEQGFLKAIKIAPKAAVAHAALGQFYADQQKWDQAVGAFQTAVQQAPSDNNHRHQLAVALARSGKIEQALPHFTKTVGEAEAHYNVGLLLHEKGDVAAAETHFLAAVTQNPQLSQAQYWLDEIRRERNLRGVIAQGPGGGTSAGAASTVSQVAGSSVAPTNTISTRISSSGFASSPLPAASAGFVAVPSSGWQVEQKSAEDLVQSFEPPPYPGRSTANGYRSVIQQPNQFSPAAIQSPAYRQPAFPAPTTNPYGHTASPDFGMGSSTTAPHDNPQFEQLRNQRSGQ
jgi:Tfp pilus assembly protein PilF